MDLLISSCEIALLISDYFIPMYYLCLFSVSVCVNICYVLIGTCVAGSIDSFSDKTSRNFQFIIIKQRL